MIGGAWVAVAYLTEQIAAGRVKVLDFPPGEAPVCPASAYLAAGLFCGSSLTPRQMRPVFSAAMRVEPEPRNGLSTKSPRLVRSRSASSSIAVGLTVGWSWSPRRASEPSDEAPGQVHTFERQRPLLPSSTLLTCEAEPFLNNGRSRAASGRGSPCRRWSSPKR